MEEKKIEEEVVEDVEEEEFEEILEDLIEEDSEVEAELEPEEEKCACYSVEPPKRPWKSTYVFATYDCTLCGRRVKK